MRDCANGVSSFLAICERNNPSSSKCEMEYPKLTVASRGEQNHFDLPLFFFDHLRMMKKSIDVFRGYFVLLCFPAQNVSSLFWNHALMADCHVSMVRRTWKRFGPYFDKPHQFFFITFVFQPISILLFAFKKFFV